MQREFRGHGDIQLLTTVTVLRFTSMILLTSSSPWTDLPRERGCPSDGHLLAGPIAVPRGTP
jgi:hypothetical protein